MHNLEIDVVFHVEQIQILSCQEFMSNAANYRQKKRLPYHFCDGITINTDIWFTNKLTITTYYKYGTSLFNIIVRAARCSDVNEQSS
jgi:hypothetical protein